MNEETRGKILNPKYAKQIVDFSGLRYDKITPTDFDGYIDFWGQGHWFFEAKYKDAVPCYGQKLALKRIADKAGPLSICIIASHDCPCEESIIASETIVSEVRFLQRWITPSKSLTTKEVTDAFTAYVKNKDPEIFYKFLTRIEKAEVEENRVTLLSLEWLASCP